MPAPAIQIPKLEDVTDLMHGLLGLKVTPATDCPQGDYSVGEYRNDAGETIAYIGCDLESGCRLSAALTQIPASCIAEAVREGRMPENMSENLDEVFNISVNLIAKPDHGRVAFAGAAHGDVSAEVKEGMAAFEASEYCFEIERYGKCRFVIWA